MTVDIQCGDLSTPANGEITSCSSGSVGVGYEGDTCSLTCNTGYELIGSDTRTCQSDGSWSGSDDVCRRGNIMCKGECCGALMDSVPIILLYTHKNILKD